MPAVRLPLQVGRAALAQSARFAATVWLGPLLLLLGTAIAGAGKSDDGVRLLDVVLGVAVVLAGIVCITVAVMSLEVAKADRPSDVLLSGDGLTVEGGAHDGARYAWSQIRGCALVAAESRTALGWLLLSLLTGRRIASLVARAKEPVVQLQLQLHDGTPIAVGEAESGERESLTCLRDAILGAIAAPAPAPPLPDEILKCPGCGAAQVPVAQSTMACPFCAATVAVPAELQERLRARVVLDRTRGQAKLIARLVAQPSARWAGRLVVTGRRVMTWTTPIAVAVVIGLLYHSDSAAQAEAGFGELRTVSNATFVKDALLLPAICAVVFAIVCAVIDAYLLNRRALRILAENFGAVPPATPGAPSSCRQCGAPLPTAGDALLVACAYCAADNVLGVDPRPAALRRTSERRDLHAALRQRRGAQLRLALVIPAALALAAGIVHLVHQAAALR